MTMQEVREIAKKVLKPGSAIKRRSLSGQFEKQRDIRIALQHYMPPNATG